MASTLPSVRMLDAVDDDVHTGSDIKPAKIAKTSTPTESNDPIIKALMDVSKATARAAAICKERLSTVKGNYYSGGKTGQDPEIVEAQTYYGQRVAELNDIVSEASSFVARALIYKLPTELLFLIFHHLDNDGLLVCQDTCRLWREVLSSKAERVVTTKDAPTLLQGTISEVDMKWTKMRRILAPPAFLSVEMHQSCKDLKLDDSALYAKIGRSQITQGIPSQWLREFKYRSSVHGKDGELYKAVLRCPNLKVLHWESFRDEPDHRGYDSSRIKISEAVCELEDLKYDSILSFEIDYASEKIFRGLKRLHTKSGVYHALESILKAARTTLKYLHVDYLPYSMESSIVMEKLIDFSLHDSCSGQVPIVAPRAQYVFFDHGEIINQTFLNSCRYTIKSLHIKWRGQRTVGRLQSELFNMPELENLHLDYLCRPATDCTAFKREIADYKEFSTPAFWDIFKQDDMTKVQGILPKLQMCTILHDPILDEPTVLCFLEKRSLLGWPPLRRLVIHLANHCSHNTSGLEALRNSLPGFEYKCFDEWSDKSIMKWTLKTFFEFEFVSFDWAKLSRFQNVVEVLHITLPHDKDVKNATRLHSELFRMPQLKNLLVNFKNYWSRESPGLQIWEKIASGVNEQDGLVLTDIFPKLKELKVVNDSRLDEEKIVKFIEVRKSLDLPPLERMTVYLSNGNSKSIGQLKSLRHTMPGFSYRPYDVWWMEEFHGPSSWTDSDPSSE